jgi:hypothetical protein
MQHELKDIDEKQIFTPGWFQAPQLMLMTHKRFQNYYDVEKLQKAKSEFKTVYLLATRAAVVYGGLSDAQYAEMKLLADHGVAKLYTIP